MDGPIGEDRWRLSIFVINLIVGMKWVSIAYFWKVVETSTYTEELCMINWLSSKEHKLFTENQFEFWKISRKKVDYSMFEKYVTISETHFRLQFTV